MFWNTSVSISMNYTLLGMLDYYNWTTADSEDVLNMFVILTVFLRMFWNSEACIFINYTLLCILDYYNWATADSLDMFVILTLFLRFFFKTSEQVKNN